MHAGKWQSHRTTHPTTEVYGRTSLGKDRPQTLHPTVKQPIPQAARVSTLLPGMPTLITPTSAQMVGLLRSCDVRKGPLGHQGTCVTSRILRAFTTGQAYDRERQTQPIIAYQGRNSSQIGSMAPDHRVRVDTETPPPPPQPVSSCSAIICRKAFCGGTAGNTRTYKSCTI